MDIQKHNIYTHGGRSFRDCRACSTRASFSKHPSHPTCAKHSKCRQAQEWNPDDCDFCQKLIAAYTQASDLNERTEAFMSIRASLNSLQKATKDHWTYETDLYSALRSNTSANSPKRKRIESDTAETIDEEDSIIDDWNDIYPGQSKLFHMAIQANQESFIEDGVLWNKIAYPVLKLNDECLKDIRTNQTLRVKFHSSGLFYTLDSYELDEDRTCVLRVDKAFNAIEEEICLFDVGTKSNTSPGRVITLHEERQSDFMKSFFAHLDALKNSKDATWPLKWKEAVPAVTFVVPTLEKCTAEPLSEIFNPLELNLSEEAAALAMIYTPKVRKSSTSLELEKRKVLGVHISTVIGMETLAQLRDYIPLKGLVKNTLVTLSQLFLDWHAAKSSLRSEFLSGFDKGNVFYQKLKYSTPLCRGLFPQSLVTEVKTLAEARVLGADQLLNMHKPGTSSNSYVQRDKAPFSKPTEKFDQRKDRKQPFQKSQKPKGKPKIKRNKASGSSIGKSTGKF